MTGTEIISRTRALVAEYQPTSHRDRDSRDEILAALDTLSRPFSRDAQTTHITASAIVTGRRGTVLHRHKITGTWLQPGGHVDDGEAPWDSVLRELVEETGLVVAHRDATRLFDLDVHDTPHRHRHLDLRFLVDAEDNDPVPGPHESPDVHWFSWDEALWTADPTLLEVLPKVQTWGSATPSVARP